MFLLATRGRPQACTALIAAMRAVQDEPEVAVMVDDDPSVYGGVRWPGHWRIHYATARMELTKAMNWLYRAYPGRPFYGHFSDHFRPLTPWSRPLIEAADEWFIAWPDDGHVSHYQVAACPVFGGKLAAAMGWLFLPTQIHLATEHPWRILWERLNIGKRVDAVRCTREDVPYTVASAVHRNKIAALDTASYYRWIEEECDRWVGDVRDALLESGLEWDGQRIASVYGQTPPAYYRDGAVRA